MRGESKIQKQKRSTARLLYEAIMKERNEMQNQSDYRRGTCHNLRRCNNTWRANLNSHYAVQFGEKQFKHKNEYNKK